MTQQITHAISALIANSKTVYVSSVDENGYPNTKAMYPTKHSDLKTHYFSTNLSSIRAAQFNANPKACIYFCGESDIEGVMFIGTAEVFTDAYHKELIWSEGDEKYYPKGVTDEDYCVFKFTASTGRYFHDTSVAFDIKELLN